MSERLLHLVGAAHFLLGAHNHSARYCAFLHFGAGDGALYRDDDDVADGSVAAAGTAQDMDAEDFLGTAVVGYVEA